MAGKKKRSGPDEWVGGVATMPAYVSGEGDPYRPELLLWMSAEGLILGTTMAKPGEVLATAAEHLRATIAKPMIGPAASPARVRVASPELADVLRPAHPAIEIVCAPTPEIDAAAEAMRQSMEALHEGDDEDESYLSPEIDAAAMAALFGAAARFYRAKPWAAVPHEACLFEVSIERLDVREAAACVIGQMGESFGLVLFSDVAGFDAYGDAAHALRDGRPTTMPPIRALNFEAREELSPSLLEEVAHHGWEVAGTSAYPWLVVMDEDAVSRPPTAREVTIFEALTGAISAAIADVSALRSAWSGGPAFARAFTVATHVGSFDVSLRALPPRASPPARPPAEVLADLARLAKDGATLAEEPRGTLEDELMESFVASPEAEAITNGEACALVMDMAAEAFGVTIATLDADRLRAILFEIIPREIAVRRADAQAIVGELRGFYAFLKRAAGLAHADACLGVLGGDVVTRLEATFGEEKPRPKKTSAKKTAKKAPKKAPKKGS